MHFLTIRKLFRIVTYLSIFSFILETAFFPLQAEEISLKNGTIISERVSRISVGTVFFRKRQCPAFQAFLYQFSYNIFLNITYNMPIILHLYE